MTEPNPPTPGARRATPRPSVHGTVRNIAAVAAMAAALVWSALFVDLLGKRSDAVATPAAPTGQATNSSVGQPAQVPAPVTTRTS